MLPQELPRSEEQPTTAPPRLGYPTSGDAGLRHRWGQQEVHFAARKKNQGSCEEEASACEAPRRRRQQDHLGTSEAYDHEAIHSAHQEIHFQCYFSSEEK